MHRSRSREKSRTSRCYSPSTRCSLAEGNVQSKTRNELFRTEHEPRCECSLAEKGNLITLEFKKSCSKKGSEMPIKALIDEEMSRDRHKRRSSPSLIARLMGLDTVPSPELKEIRSSLKKEFHEKATMNKTFVSNNDEHQEFKDVFEVVQVPKVKRQKEEIVKSGIASLRRCEIGKEFKLPSSSDGTTSSIYRIPPRCKEVNSVGVLELDKDIFLPYFHEPSKHLLDLARSPSPRHSSFPSVLMASKDSPTSSCQTSFRSEKNIDSYIKLQGDDIQSFRKHSANCYYNPSRKHLCSLIQKLSETAYTENDGYCTQPTEIVILKPSLQRSQMAGRTIPLAKSLNNLQCSLKSNMKVPVDDNMKLYIEEKAGREILLDEQSMGHNGPTKEISKEITKRMRSKLASGRQKVSIEKFNEYEKDKRSCTSSSIINGKNSRSSISTSAIIYEHSDSYSHSSSSPNDSSVTKEARKRLSERWKLTNHSQKMGFLSRESNTLAEMLALSDSETPNVTRDALVIKETPERKLYLEDFPEPRKHPLQISSKDGRKDDFCRSLPRSKSLPARTSVHGNSQLNSRNGPGNIANRIIPNRVEDMSNWMSLDNHFIRQKKTAIRNMKYHSAKDELHSKSEDNTSTEREIHVSSEELKISNDLGCLSEQHVAMELPNSSTEKIDVADNISNFQSNTDKPSLTPEKNGFEELQYFTKSDDIMKQLEYDKHEFPAKEVLICHDEDELPSTNCNKPASISPESYNEADQPSPVSVLEIQFEEEEEEEFATGSFEKISADLQKLRNQLRLLKQESANNKEDIETLQFTDEEPDVLQAFRDDEERNYSYILDMFIDCENHEAGVNSLFTSINSAEYPVDLHMFEKLEKKYKLHYSWLRSDRKLLFELTNFALADIIKQNSGLQSKMVLNELVDEVWQTVVKQMKVFGSRAEVNLNELSWADLGDDYKELVERQIVSLLQEDLVDELLIELAC